MTAVEFATLVKRARRRADGEWWDACCPAHDDRRASLSFTDGEHALVVECHAGCSRERIAKALGRRAEDFAHQHGANGRGRRARQIVATYDYTDGTGRLLYQVVRYDPKDFSQRRPDGCGGWTWDLKGVRRVLYRLPDLVEQSRVFWVEGEKDADRLAALGLAVSTSPGGAKAWRDAYAAQLAELGVREVVILPDQDAPGERYALAVARACYAAGLTARVVRLPGLAPKGDVSDWLDAVGTREALETLADEAPAEGASGSAADAPSDRPDVPGPDQRPGFEIPRTFYDLHTLASRVWTLVEEHNRPPTLFRCGGLSWLENTEHGRCVVRQLDAARLRQWLSARVDFFRMVQRTPRPVRPPGDLLEDLLVRPEPPVPILTRVVASPVIAADGTIHATPGYHPATRCVYAPAAGFTVPPVSAVPTDAERQAALALLEEVFCDFPFTSAADRAHTLVALLAVFARDLIDGPTPLILLTKPAPGTGATLVTNAISVIALGGEPEVMTLPHDTDEVRKKITSVLRGAPSLIVLDNLRGIVDSGDLSSVLTARTWKDRLLGKNEEVSLPVRTIWLGTSNNAALTTELGRRTVRVALDAAVERPWLRARDGQITFRHPDLLAWATVRRGDLVHACLTLIAAWLAAGRPKGSETLGRYEEWAGVMGGILGVAGIDGFLGNIVELYAQDDIETLDLKRLLDRWWQTFADAPTTPAKLFPLAQDPDVDLPLSGKDDTMRRISFGRYLQRNKNRVLDLDRDLSVRIDRANRPDSHRPLWRLLKTAPRPAPTAGWGESRDSGESRPRHARKHVVEQNVCKKSDRQDSPKSPDSPHDFPDWVTEESPQ